jgi:predicted secreted protein
VYRRSLLDAEPDIALFETGVASVAFLSGGAGGGGVFKVSYTGAKPGESTDVLMYARPWEKESDPAAKVNLTVKVN